jgi:hypothetical protein
VWAKGYTGAFGDALVDRHLAMKWVADPAMILNRDGFSDAA